MKRRQRSSECERSAAQPAGDRNYGICIRPPEAMNSKCQHRGEGVQSKDYSLWGPAGSFVCGSVPVKKTSEEERF